MCVILITGESIAKSKSANPADPGTNKPNWKPHGILKNKKDDNSQKRGDTTGYIKRNTVQRILDQQKKVGGSGGYISI